MAHSGGRRRAAPVSAPVLVIAFRPGRIRQGPSMYEMEGPCPASPHRLVSCLAGRRRAPPAGAKYPREDRSPGSSHVPGVSPGWYQFPAAKHFYSHTRASRKSRRPAISGSSAIHEPIHRKRLVIRISRRLSTVYSQSIDRLVAPGRSGQGTRCEPGNAGTALTGCNRLIFHIGLKVITRAAGFEAGTDGLTVAADPAWRPGRS